jgi:hypothetical protein
MAGDSMYFQPETKAQQRTKSTEKAQKLIKEFSAGTIAQ